MEKRAFLAVILSLSILIGWQMLFLKKSVPPTSEVLPRVKTEDKKEEKISEEKIPFVSVTPKKTEEKEIPIETELYSAVFSTRGGALKSWMLKKYKDKIGEDGRGINLVNQSNSDFYPFFLRFSLSKYHYLTSVKYDIEEHNENEIVLSYQDQKIKIKRTYRFVPNAYQVEHTTHIWASDNFGGDIFLGTSEGFPSDPEKKVLKDAYWGTRSFIYHLQAPNKTVRKKLTNVKENEEIKSVMNWMGIENQYFLFSMVNRSDVRPYLLLSSPLHGAWGIALQYPFHKAPQKDFFEARVTGYIGPKEVSRLKEVGSKLEEAVDFGMFSFICIPLLKIMHLFYQYVIHNWGVAILFLTLLVRVVFHPLTKKSYVSMREMQRIQPQMAKIKEKFKDDKEQMNKAIMDLMKANKVNPLGGCLPILIQMPIFFALYQVFYNAIELYQAPFFGWIQDLSAKDPYYISPVLMGGAMFLQQKMTPATSMDPAQQKMMLFMPVIFSFFMIGLPSGLVIYILFSTLLQVASQYLVNREFIKKGL